MKKIVFSLGFLISLCSCNDFLERPQPENSIPVEGAFESIEDLQLALMGAYRALLETEAPLILFPDYITQNSNYIGPGTLDQELAIAPFPPFALRIGRFWNRNYQAINQANLIFKTLDENPDLGEEGARNLIRGEALFLRGFAYFEMVRLFAKPYDSLTSSMGVPIMLAPTTAKSEITFPERASVEDVYERAISDLTQASSFLPEPEDQDQGRVSRFAAIAMLARITFQQRNYEVAAEWARQVITSTKFDLNETPREFYISKGSQEEIWTLARTPQEFGQLAFRSGDGWIELTDDLLQEGFDKIVSPGQYSRLQNAGLEVSDLRRTTLTRTAGNRTYSLKYDDQSGADDVPVLRLAEIYLIRAEALVRLKGTNTESMGLLNEIRSRSLRVTDMNGDIVSGGESYIEYKDFELSEKALMIEAIVRERRVEYFLEGNRFHDLMRLKDSVQGFAYDANELRWPIPQSEIDANKNLVQNPGY